MDSPSTGFQTSEGKLALALVAVGLVLQGTVMPFLEHLQQISPGLTWVAPALGMCGTLLQIVAVITHALSRTSLKKQALLVSTFSAPVPVSPGEVIKP